MATVKYGDLTQTNPEYKPREWTKHRALYAGGSTLLGSQSLLSEMIPQNPAEDGATYQARTRMAEYDNYIGEIVDFIVCSLGADPLSMEATPKAPDFFSEFQRSTDGQLMTLSGLMRKQILTALITKRAWTLIDLPPTSEGAVIESAADEEQLDALRALAFPIEPESVVDWGESPSGSIEWAVVKMCSMSRQGLTGRRDTITEQYTYFDKSSWQRYEISYHSKKGPPNPKTDVPLVAEGTHSFGAVPLIPLELPDGMYALAKLANMAVAHFRKRSGLSWAQNRAFYPQAIAYLGPEMSSSGEIPSVQQQDPGRASTQTYGIGRVVQFGSQDKLEYLSPDTAILTTALEDLNATRDEMHRIMSHMALAADNSAAALARSGDSKGQDKASAAVILGELGRLAREHAVRICTIASAGRKDPPCVWNAHGMETFELADALTVSTEARTVLDLNIPSPTFKRLYLTRIAKTFLQGSATPDDLRTVSMELQSSTEEEAKEEASEELEEKRESTIPPPPGELEVPQIPKAPKVPMVEPE